MLRNRSRRAVTTKQASLMADHPQSSRTQIGHFTKPTPTLSSLFGSPKFNLFTSRITPFDSDFSLLSPTSILDTSPSIYYSKSHKPDSNFEPSIPKHQRFQPPEAFGLADLVENSISDDSGGSISGSVSSPTKPVNRRVLFGSKLRVQIPSADFGTKSRAPRYSRHGHGNSCVQTRVQTSYMELSEDYTCVISHGPTPTTRHIFDNCVFVESSCSVSSPLLDKESNHSMNMANFLSLCCTCKKTLDQRHDIYMYRGEKAFCSSECRYQEMLIGEMES